VVCRRGTYANPTVGIMAAALNLFRPGSWTFLSLQSALPDYSARISTEIDRSIVRRVRVRYRKGSESYTEVWGLPFTSAPWPDGDRRRAIANRGTVAGCCKQASIADGRGHRAILVQGTASKGPVKGQCNCRFLLQNVLILSRRDPGRSAMVHNQAKNLNSAVQFFFGPWRSFGFTSTSPHHLSGTSKENE